LLSLLIGIFSITGQAQVTKVSLQASGLTCSMCSKAVLNALQKIPFVEKVQVDIKDQQYHITFSNQEAISFDGLTKAVEDAGFSVATFVVNADVSAIELQKDKHVKIGNQYFHFLNATDQKLDGSTSFTVVDKSFTTEKKHKKYSSMSRMECVKTGKSSGCCSSEGVTEETRIYHAIL
jgi:copper chaperone CopZ